MDLLGNTPSDFSPVLQVIVFSLLIGLEQRCHHLHEEFGQLFGTYRSFTLIGLAGFVLYLPESGGCCHLPGGGAAA